VDDEGRVWDSVHRKQRFDPETLEPVDSLEKRLEAFSYWQLKAEYPDIWQKGMNREEFVKAILEAYDKKE